MQAAYIAVAAVAAFMLLRPAPKQAPRNGRQRNGTNGQDPTSPEYNPGANMQPSGPDESTSWLDVWEETLDATTAPSSSAVTAPTLTPGSCGPKLPIGGLPSNWLDLPKSDPGRVARRAWLLCKAGG